MKRRLFICGVLLLLAAAVQVARIALLFFSRMEFNAVVCLEMALAGAGLAIFNFDDAAGKRN